MIVQISSRVLVLDDRGNVFLFHAPLEAGGFIWLPPGGGLRAGESHKAAAERETLEETGWCVEVGSLIWKRHFVGDSRQGRFENREEWFVAQLNSTKPKPTADPQSDPAAALPWRWWSSTEIVASSEKFVPRQLGCYLSLLLARRLSAEPFLIED